PSHLCLSYDILGLRRLRCAPRAPLFPYTALFRSWGVLWAESPNPCAPLRGYVGAGTDPRVNESPLGRRLREGRRPNARETLVGALNPHLRAIACRCPRTCVCVGGGRGALVRRSRAVGCALLVQRV